MLYLSFKKQIITELRMSIYKDLHNLYEKFYQLNNSENNYVLKNII